MHVWPGPKDMRQHGVRYRRSVRPYSPSSMQPGSLDETAPQLQYECLWMRVSYISSTAWPKPVNHGPHSLHFSRSCLSFLSVLALALPHSFRQRWA